MSRPEIRIEICKPVETGILHGFYKRNDICEAEFGEELSEIVLQYPGVWVAAYAGDGLIGFVRALHDGLSADIMEFSLDLRYQDRNEHQIGCAIDSDPHGIARDMGKALLKELRRRGCYFFSAILHGPYQPEFYESIGFRENEGHKEYIIDARPYVPGGDEKASEIDSC